MSKLLKLPEVAQRLNVSEKTVRRYVKAGVLPSSFIGNAYRVSEEDVEGYLRRARVEIGEEAPKGFGRPSETGRPPVLLEGTLGGKGAFSGDLLVGIDAVFEDLMRDLELEEQDRLKIESAQKKVHELVSQSAS